MEGFWLQDAWIWIGGRRWLFEPLWEQKLRQ
jgi:hypothetical protein